MRRSPLIALFLVPLVASGCGGGASQSDRDKAVTEAADAYREAKMGGVKFDRGPCIAERLPGLDDWVVDVAHDPRRPVDDDPANQCQRYRAGQAHHFVELDPAGKLMRAE